jgi:hypothetical protein
MKTKLKKYKSCLNKLSKQIISYLIFLLKVPNMEKWHKIFICLFLIPIFAFGLISIFIQKPTFSISENRMLKKAPVLNTTTIFNDTFMKDFENYYADTFPFREALMPFNKNINAIYMIGSKNGTAYINIGEIDLGQGQTALTSHPAVSNNSSKTTSSKQFNSSKIVTSSSPQITSSFPSQSVGNATDTGDGLLIIGDRILEIYSHQQSKIDNYANIINRLNNDLPGVQIYSLLAPTSVQYYSPLSYHINNRDQQKSTDYLDSKLNPDIKKVPVISTIGQHINDYLYFRTDHHWTARGAYWAYSSFAQVAGFEPVALSSFAVTGKIDAFIGNLFGFIANYPQADTISKDPDYVEYFMPIVKTDAKVYSSTAMTNGVSIQVVSQNIGKGQTDKYLCFISGDNPLTVIDTSVKNGRKILVTKESYANAFIPFLTSHYEQIYVVDLRSFNVSGKPSLNIPGFIKQQGIGEVLVINYSFAMSNPTFINSFSKSIP